MPVKELDLTFASLEELDGGRLAVLLKRHMAQVAQDCMNRPTDPAKRKVLIEFAMTPVYDAEARDCEGVKLTIEAKSKVLIYLTHRIPSSSHQ